MTPTFLRLECGPPPQVEDQDTIAKVACALLDLSAGVGFAP